MKETIKIILAFGLFICLFEMPYQYYQLIRFVGMSIFSYLAYDNYVKSKTKRAYLYFCLALLFQPFFKIALGRAIWNILDILIGILLIIDVFHNIRNKNNRDLYGKK